MVWKGGSLEDYSIVTVIRDMNRLLRRLFSFRSFKTFWREMFVLAYECSGRWCGVYGVSVEIEIVRKNVKVSVGFYSVSEGNIS
jgi:hypothetical protein